MKNLFALATAAALALACLGCDNTDTPTGLPEGFAELRVAHLVPDAPAVDVWLNGRVALASIPYGDVTPYTGLSAGTYRVQVTPAGATSPVVIDAVVDLGNGVSYTVAATGLLGGGTLGPLVLVDDRTRSAQAKVRFVHASPDAPAVDVAVAGGPVLFGDVAFNESDGYLAVDGGTYDLEVRVAGTSTVALALPGVGLAGRTNYTVFATGRLSDGSLGALPVIDAD